MRFAACLCIALMLALSACAVGDIVRTSNPPITLGPQPTIVVSGNCGEVEDLERWTQAAYFQTTEFVRTLSAAAGKSRSDVYADVLHMQDLRDDMTSRPTPDCAADVQRALARAMNDATRTLQAYANGDLSNLADVLPGLLAQLQQVIEAENVVISRLTEKLGTPIPQR